MPRQRVGPVQVGGPGTLSTAAQGAHQPRHNQRVRVFVDENTPQPTAVPGPAAGAPASAELPTGRAMHKENVRKAGPWGAPQKASKRPTPASGTTPPAFRGRQRRGTGYCVLTADVAISPLHVQRGSFGYSSMSMF